MNNEFIVSSDGNVIVTDEKGNTSKRTYNGNCEECLLCENKIEIVDNRLKKINDDLRDKKSVIFLSKKMLKIQPILLLLISMGMSVYGGLNSTGDVFTDALFNGVEGFVCGTFITGATSIYFGILNSIYLKKSNRIENEIIVVQKLKEDYEKELSDIKTKQITIDSPTTAINESISLIGQTNSMEEQINEEINKANPDSLNQHPKKLVLRIKK